MNDSMDQVNTIRSFSLIGPFYTACLLKQMQVEWDEDSVLQEVIEMRRKIESL